MEVLTKPGDVQGRRANLKLIGPETTNPTPLLTKKSTERCVLFLYTSVVAPSCMYSILTLITCETMSIPQCILN